MFHLYNLEPVWSSPSMKHQSPTLDMSTPRRLYIWRHAAANKAAKIAVLLHRRVLSELNDGQCASEYHPWSLEACVPLRAFAEV
jgi:hypothetical protein